MHTCDHRYLDMKRLFFLMFLQFVSVSIQGQSLRQGQLGSHPKQPTAVVKSLYRQVIARQPLGIPYGENWKVFAPYLSKGLVQKITLARSCEGDWVRQNKGTMEKAPIAWAETGFFSGDEALSEPSNFQVERAELNQDGSVRVYVKLSSSPPNDKPFNWEVAVQVVTEEKRPVVDDVVYLKGEVVDTEYRLSEILKLGCDGPRWVGDGRL